MNLNIEMVSLTYLLFIFIGLCFLHFLSRELWLDNSFFEREGNRLSEDLKAKRRGVIIKKTQKEN